MKKFRNDESFASPRPTPNFFTEQQTFSTKKQRGTPRDSVPPRPPIKSCPPISRIFPHRPVQRAQVVSFRSTENSFLSTRYNENNKDLYFEQCFIILSKLGAGSFGEVFKVKNKEDGSLYAVKRTQVRFRGESDRRRKLEEVAKHEKLPPHQNCVHFYKAWEERQHLYIQIELCKNSLSQVADGYHDLSELTLWNYLVDLLMAVKHLHDNDLIHMDIKPENIFVSFDGICKLGDFGLVLDVSKVDLSEAQEGDPKYLAPELMQGKFGKPADVFSLGMTMLELASDLDLPRGGEGWHILRRGELPEEFLRDKSFDLKYVIRHMLDRCPGSRPTVDQLLQFPSVRKVWKRRMREYMINRAVSRVKGFFSSILTFFLLMSGIFFKPFRLYRRHSSRPQLPSDISHGSSSSVDNSISDDDCFDDEVSICNNSIGAPLDSSTSSECSGDFILPRIPPRKAFTTPVLRHRPCNVPTPKSSSPVIPDKISKGSPGAGFDSSFGSDRSLTPVFNVSASNLIEVEEVKTGIEPKNLLGMFEAASDED
ncbi:hypothetical protein SNE40_003325 [Patella caerulea]|uniref:Membrane-associated tyrosine- and threonine-specific cdc2-inhibitory kinase n=1 Tax=Patella caerulea TaxID=87958 RepID=A0AAN8K9J9_PATCE